MTDLLVTSFYTPTWKYPEHAERLRAECRALGLSSFIVEREDRGGYVENCRIKPSHVREALDFGRPVLWLDVDASILGLPVDLDYGLDFMARPMAADRDRRWHVGTLFFNRSDAADDLVDAWLEAVDLGDASDEWALDRVWRAGGFDSVRWGELPATYFEILERENGVARPGTIVAHRLSRSPAKRRYYRGRV